MKKLLYLLLLLIFIAGIIIAGLILFINPNKLKPVLIKEVKMHTGYQLVIEGQLAWSFYPLIGIKAEHMLLYAPQENKPMADLHGVTVASKLQQLWQARQQLQGKVYISRLKLMDMQMQDVHMNLNWQNKHLIMKPITASLYDGKLSGEMIGSDFSALPKWSWNLMFNHIQLKPLIHDISHDETKLNISGVTQVSMLGTTSGTSRQELLQAWQGEIKLNVKEGLLEGIDLNFLADSAAALIDGRPIPQIHTGNQTRFDSLTGTAIIRQGVANLDNLLLITPAFTSRGEGSINLQSQTIDYHLLVTPISAEKIKWSVPVQIAGDLQSPSVRLDAAAINRIVVGDKLEKVKTRVQEEVKKLPEEADKFLKHLLGE